jgi:hypothetical protein
VLDKGVEKMRKEEEIEKKFIELFNKIDEVQEGQDSTCTCTNCYWNYNNECVSESLNEFKMTPSSIDCKGYWKR